MEFRMNEAKNDVKAIGDIIADYVAQGRIAALERAFRNNPKLMALIADYWKAHNKARETHKKVMQVLNDLAKDNKLEQPKL
jgi:predicted MPP superfamily phosphohydrolase